jgi:hypothetical protein
MEYVHLPWRNFILPRRFFISPRGKVEDAHFLSFPNLRNVRKNSRYVIQSEAKDLGNIKREFTEIFLPSVVLLYRDLPDFIQFNRCIE